MTNMQEWNLLEYHRMPGMTVEEWDLRFFAKHSPTGIERAVYQRRLNDFLAAKDLESCIMPRTKRLAEYINGSIKGGEIEFKDANRVPDGIMISYSITPNNGEVFDRTHTTALDFDFKELANEVRHKAEQQIVEVGQ